jgi:hypothetical protein
MITINGKKYYNVKEIARKLKIDHQCILWMIRHDVLGIRWERELPEPDTAFLFPKQSADYFIAMRKAGY